MCLYAYVISSNCYSGHMWYMHQDLTYTYLECPYIHTYIHIHRHVPSRIIPICLEWVRAVSAQGVLSQSSGSSCSSPPRKRLPTPKSAKIGLSQSSLFLLYCHPCVPRSHCLFVLFLFLFCFLFTNLSVFKVFFCLFVHVCVFVMRVDCCLLARCFLDCWLAKTIRK